MPGKWLFTASDSARTDFLRYYLSLLAGPQHSQSSTRSACPGLMSRAEYQDNRPEHHLLQISNELHNVTMSLVSNDPMSSSTATPSSGKGIPRRPAMKIPLPPSPWGPRNLQLGILVADAIKASPSPRRSQPEFYCSNLQRDLPAPPPTPVMPILSAGSSSSTSSESSTPGSSNEVKHVTFVDFWRDDEGGTGKTRSELDC